MDASTPIVVGIDGSPQSRLATDWALAEARRRKTSVELLHVRAVDSFAGYPIPPGFSVTGQLELSEEIRTSAGRLLDQAVTAARAAAPDVTVEGRVGSGRPAHELITRSENAQLVVLGARGGARVSHLLLGSVSAHVAAHARAPVVVVRSEPRRDGPVVVGVDGSAVSGDAIGFAFEEASMRRTSLLAVHCWDADPVPGYEIWTADERLHEQLASEAARLLSESMAGWGEKHPDVHVESVLTPGHPVEVLARRSREAQLLVVGSHGRGAFAGMLLGSVSGALLRSADCPVAVVRG
jgi:nucleotide-binding universal stress UspA family protein